MPPGDSGSQPLGDRRTVKFGLLGLFIALWIVSCLSPPYPDELVLQHIPTVIAVLLLVAVEHFQPLSLGSYVAVLCFLSLHLLGARYLYSNVPYHEWFDLLQGREAKSLPAWRRNHYDRLVHFFYGLLLTGVACEFLRKATAMSRGWAWTMAISVIMGTSALYEIIEWCIALLLAPDAAEAYNGQQGDMWDAQKDMTLALVGAVIARTASIVASTIPHTDRIATNPLPPGERRVRGTTWRR
jgi:putative membrane protein